MADVQPLHSSGYSYDLPDRASTPRVGHFSTRSNNPLLSKPVLGAVAKPYHDLPTDFDHVYGLSTQRINETDNKKVPKPSSRGARQAPRNFRALNKAAIRDGNLDARSVREYHVANDLRLSGNNAVWSKSTAPPDVDNVVHGAMKPADSTDVDMHQLVGHGYRFGWMAGRELAEDALRLKRGSKPSQTKASLMRAQRGQAVRAKEVEAPGSPPPASTLWKMKRFGSAESKVKAAVAN